MNAVGINIAAFMTDRQQEYELSRFQPNFRYFGQRLRSPTTQRSVQQIEPNFVDVEAKHRPLYRYDLLLPSLALAFRRLADLCRCPIFDYCRKYSAETGMCTFSLIE